MNLLALESATDLVGAAVLTPSGRAERVHEGGRRHAESIVPAIEEVLASAGVTLDQLDAVAVDIGPGLFTGLRVGVATAKALAQGLGIGVVPVSSLDVLAAAAWSAVRAEGPCTVVAVVDARRGEVFTARYEFGAGTDDGDGADDGDPDPAAVRTGPPELRSPEQLVASLVPPAGPRPGPVTGPIVVVGDGAVRHLALLGPLDGVDVAHAATIASPSPSVLAGLAARRLAAGEPALAPLDVVPDYRREADARINWEQRTGPAPGAVGAAG